VLLQQVGRQIKFKGRIALVYFHGMVFLFDEM
jgi:hypothetical protein